jgi:hypothetical protein
MESEQFWSYMLLPPLLFLVLLMILKAAKRSASIDNRSRLSMLSEAIKQKRAEHADRLHSGRPGRT